MGQLISGITLGERLEHPDRLAVIKRATTAIDLANHSEFEIVLELLDPLPELPDHNRIASPPESVTYTPPHHETDRAGTEQPPETQFFAGSFAALPTFAARIFQIGRSHPGTLPSGTIVETSENTAITIAKICAP